MDSTSPSITDKSIPDRLATLKTNIESILKSVSHLRNDLVEDEWLKTLEETIDSVLKWISNANLASNDESRSRRKNYPGKRKNQSENRTSRARPGPRSAKKRRAIDILEEKKRVKDTSSRKKRKEDVTISKKKALKSRVSVVLVKLNDSQVKNWRELDEDQVKIKSEVDEDQLNCPNTPLSNDLDEVEFSNDCDIGGDDNNPLIDRSDKDDENFEPQLQTGNEKEEEPEPEKPKPAKTRRKRKGKGEGEESTIKRKPKIFNKGPVPCPHCDITFVERFAYLLHIRCHFGDYPLRCECGAAFKTPKGLNTHIFTRHKKRSGPVINTCPKCNLTVKGRGRFETHMRTHTGELAHLCNICGKALSTPRSLKLHIKFQHENGAETETPLVCKYCGFKTTSASTMWSHEKAHEGKLEKTCPQCNRTVTALHRHIREVHLKIRKYACHLCDHKFKKKNHLDRHIGSHNNPNGRRKGYHVERPDNKPILWKKKIPRMNDDNLTPATTETENTSAATTTPAASAEEQTEASEVFLSNVEVFTSKVELVSYLLKPGEGVALENNETQNSSPS